MPELQQYWVRSQHPLTQWNLRGGRWSSVEYSTKLPFNNYLFPVGNTGSLRLNFIPCLLSLLLFHMFFLGVAHREPRGGVPQHALGQGSEGSQSCSGGISSSYIVLKHTLLETSECSHWAEVNCTAGEMSFLPYYLALGVSLVMITGSQTVDLNYGMLHKNRNDDLQN